MVRSTIDIMASKNLFDAAKLKDVDAIAATYNYAPIKVALCFGFITRKELDSFLKSEGKEKVDVRNYELDTTYLDQCDIHDLNSFLYLPLKTDFDGTLLVAAADPFDEKLANSLMIKFNKNIKLVAADDLDITWVAHKKRGLGLVHDSVYSLMKRDAANSGHITFTDAQLYSLFGMIAIAVILLFVFPIPTIISLNFIASILFLSSIMFKLYLAMRGSQSELKEDVSKEELSQVKDESNPVYTILLPVYKEDKLIRKLIWNLRGLNYPQDKLDVKLLIEEDDNKTLNAVRELDFPANFEVIVIPFMMPKTKPKACNYGLYFSRGEFLTIYDAEDVPDTWQLKKAVLMFQKLPKEYVVVQGALNYFNRNENLLTKMFTLEYSYWFDYMLPGLETLDIPIPLGGTSNHFKLDKLRELGSWDPFNVTEDADLGVRVYDKQYKVGIVRSTTYEEANNEPINWIRQRSRWIKGYMQTYLVHMRNPIGLIRRIGWAGFFGFNFFIGGTAFTFLIYPILLLFFLAYLIFNITNIKAVFPDWVLYLSIFNFIAGNVLMIYINMMAVFKRRYYELIVYAVLNPIYWLMHSIAAYKGLWQLIFKPFYWEKTNHGLSKQSSASATAA
jgi:glycosyltransferase XagB